MRMMKTGNVQSAEPTCIMITMMSMRREKKSLTNNSGNLFEYSDSENQHYSYSNTSSDSDKNEETTKVIIGVLMSILIIRLSKKQKRKQIGSFVF